jgi:hypothetical protein
MRDPHVVQIEYRLIPNENVTFNDDACLIGETDEFRVNVQHNHVTLTCRQHFSTVTEARAAAESLLITWQIADALHRGRQEFRFEFKDSKIVDRDPPPAGTPQTLIAATITSTATVHASASVSVIRGKYPAIPTTFVVSPDVATLWSRYERYLSDKEPLPAMAYFCATVIEGLTGGQKHAPVRLNVSSKIFGSLRRLTTERGDQKQARKFARNATGTPLSPEETIWIESAIRMLIRRYGEYEANPTGPHSPITMADLPTLPAS